MNDVLQGSCVWEGASPDAHPDERVRYWVTNDWGQSDKATTSLHHVRDAEKVILCSFPPATSCFRPGRETECRDRYV